eukprot:3057250-Rhodomonas_salina.1
MLACRKVAHPFTAPPFPYQLPSLVSCTPIPKRVWSVRWTAANIPQENNVICLVLSGVCALSQSRCYPTVAHSHCNKRDHTSPI